MEIQAVNDYIDRKTNPKKTQITVILLMLLFTTITQTLYLTPLLVIYVSYIQPVYIVVYMLFFLIYVGDIFTRERAITSLDLLIIYLLLIPLYLGLPADILWKQPYIYGIAASREWFLAVSPLVFFYLFRTKRITLKEIFDALIALAWVYLVIYTAVAVLGNVNQYRGTHPPVYVSCNLAKGGCTYRLDVLPINFALIYYFIRFLKKNSWRSLVSFLMFVAYIVLEEKKRSMMLALAATLMIFFVTRLPLKKIILYSVVLILGLVVLIAIIYVVAPNFIQTYITMFSNVISVLEGQKVNESSVDSRIIETIEVLRIFALKPISILIGNGRISNNYNNGQYGNFVHFFPSDLAILGAIFQYGIIGYLMVQVEYVYIYIITLRVKENRNNYFFLASVYFLIYLFIDGASINCFTAGIATTPLFITLVYCFVYLEKHKDRGYEVP